MSKYVPNEMVREYHGKICQHSDVYFAKRNGTLYTAKLCNPFKGEPTAEQVENRNLFKQAQAAARTALADPEQKAQLLVAFRKQRKYRTLYGYAFAQEYAKLKDANL